MSKHEWEYFDFKRMKRCKRCGIATHAQLRFAEVVGCSGSLEAAALDRDAMDDAARRPPAMSPDAADAMAYVLHSSYAESRDKSLTEPLPKATDADISTVAGKVGEVGVYRGMKIVEAFRGPRWTKADIETIETLREIDRDVDKVCGLPPFAQVEKWREVFAKRGVGALPAAPRNHVSDAAWQLVRQWDPSRTSVMVERIEKLGCHLITCDEYDALTANQAQGTDSEWRQIAEARQVALEAAAKRITALEAECESLSRQLRSREINAEPVVTRPAWRWSPLL